MEESKQTHGLLNTGNKRDAELFWIIEHDELCWAPGEKKDENKKEIIV